MATGESDDQSTQPDNKLELGTSYKLKLGPSISKAMKGLVGGAARGSADSRRNTGLQLSSYGGRALELIPPVRRALRRRKLPRAVEGTKWHGAR